MRAQVAGKDIQDASANIMLLKSGCDMLCCLKVKRPLQESAAGARSAQDKAAGNDEEEPCYVELGMREEGNTRLASVYKPEKRGALEVRSQKASVLGVALAACRP